jgi:hypothetical protein
MNNVITLNRKVTIETPDDLMVISQFAKKYGCDKSYLYKLRDKGKLKFFKRGYYKVSEKEALMAMES